MAKKTGSTAKSTVRAKRDQIDRKKFMKDLQSILRKHHITAKVASLSFTSATGSSCTCPDGKVGVLRVVGGRVICVCPN